MLLFCGLENAGHRLGDTTAVGAHSQVRPVISPCPKGLASGSGPAGPPIPDPASRSDPLPVRPPRRQRDQSVHLAVTEAAGYALLAL